FFAVALVEITAFPQRNAHRLQIGGADLAVVGVIRQALRDGLLERAPFDPEPARTALPIQRHTHRVPRRNHARQSLHALARLIVEGVPVGAFVLRASRWCRPRRRPVVGMEAGMLLEHSKEAREQQRGATPAPQRPRGPEACGPGSTPPPAAARPRAPAPLL